MLVGLMAGGADGRSEDEPVRRPRVLIVDEDELSIALGNSLESHGASVQRAYNQSQARGLLRSLSFDLVVSEAALLDCDGEAIFREALPFLKSTPVIFTVRNAQIEQAVRIIRAGALDYIVKPYDASALADRIHDILDARRSLDDHVQGPELRMRSAAMALVGEQLKRLAGNSVSVLIVGEVGAGKSTIGRYLHQISSRNAEPFIEVRCGGLASQDAERLLFGEASAHHGDGDLGPSAGALEQVGEGTLFLDRIDELPTPIQTKLVQAIDEKRFHRVGDVRNYVPFRARLLSSSELASVKLRQRINLDLLYRLAVVEIKLPPLRNRQDDLEHLIGDLITECAAEIGSDALPLEPEALNAARLYEWPGNVRELRSRLLRALSLGNGKKISAADMFPEVIVGASVKPPTRHLDEARSAAEREQIVQALAATDGRIGDAARELGISRVTLWMKMKRLGLNHDSDRPPDADE